MFGVVAYGEIAFAEIQAAYDHSVADPFRPLLQNTAAQLVYLVEGNPFDTGLVETVHGVGPYGSAAFGEFDITYTGGATDVYLSDVGFTTEPSDSPANQYFVAQVENPLQLDVSIMQGDQFGSAAPTFGNITIINGDGALDNILAFFWTGREVIVKAGATNFSYNEFTTVFSGFSSGIEADEDTISVLISDGRARVDQQIQQTTYAGTGGLEGGSDLATQVKPLCYGECYNIEPILVDATNLVYQVHSGAMQAFTNVYDAGVALTSSGDVADITLVTPTAGHYYTQLSGGYVKLGSTPSGRITADVQGDATGGTYSSKPSDIVQVIVKNKLGSQSFAASEIDGANFNLLGAQVTGPAGIYITDRVQCSDLLDQLINPLGAWWTFTRQGKLSCGFADDPGTATVYLTADDIDEEGVKLAETIPASWRISVGYKPLGVVQPESELAGSATAARRQLVADQYRYVTSEDGTVLTANQIANERTFDTRLTSSTDANMLLARLVRIYGSRRRLYELAIHNALFQVYVGDTVNVTFPRFDLSAGRNLLVVGISEDVETDTTTLTLWG